MNNYLFHSNKKTFKSVIILSGIILLTFILGMKFQANSDRIETLTTQLAQAKEAKEKVVYIEPSDVDSYIKYIFGPDYSKAMLLLKGKGGDSCAENRNLDPNAVNDNTWWGGVGQDIGVFQISSVYQKVQPKFLYDYKVNIRIAYQLFKESGNSFKLWTCGKVYGI